MSNIGWKCPDCGIVYNPDVKRCKVAHEPLYQRVRYVPTYVYPTPYYPNYPSWYGTGVYYGVGSTLGNTTSIGQTVSGFIDNTGIGPN